jgi:hypothetical protein
VPELSAHVTQRLIEVLDCTVTLRSGVRDRSTQVSVVVSTGWNPHHVDEADRELLARYVWGAPDEEGWLTAQVAALHGYLFELEPRAALYHVCSARDSSARRRLRAQTSLSVAYRRARSTPARHRVGLLAKYVGVITESDASCSTLSKATRLDLPDERA